MVDSISEEAPRLTLIQSLQRDFIAGLFLLLPLIISIYVLIWLYATVTGPTVHLLKQFYPSMRGRGWEIGVSIFAFLFNIGIVLTAGIVTRNVIGRRLFLFFEALVGQVPVLNKIYGGTKQVLDGFSPGKKAGFQRVVLVEFPRVGSYSVGFVAGVAKGQLAALGEEERLNVFVPTTPNPTSGFLLVVESKQVKDLDISVADAIKLVVSGGSVIPEKTLPVRS